MIQTLKDVETAGGPSLEEWLDRNLIPMQAFEEAKKDWPGSWCDQD